jgi:iron complex outermembrane receptor protein
MKLFINLAIILLVTVVSGNGMVLEGSIVDPEGVPIEGVNISSSIKSISGVSDKNGNFQIDISNANIRTLTFSHIGYQILVKKISDLTNGVVIFLEPAIYKKQSIRVTALRAERGRTPVAFADVTEDDFKRDYTMADFPLILEATPNLYSFSYSGGAVGASDYKIRGFDSKRIGVYINGVPLNDPEDHYTYFYDLPDFAAEVADIQVQRGVGNSLYGDASFGGSINISSAGLSRTKRLAVTAGYGDYFAGNNSVAAMRKQSIEYSTGLLKGRWSLAGRLSQMYSGGYRRLSWYDGWAYFFTVSRLDPRMTTTVNFYGGPFQAHLAFYGIDRETMKTDRRFNWSTYENEIDDFNQPHLEIHNCYQISRRVTLNNTFYYIHGKGYYEGYKYGKGYFEYNIDSSLILDTNIVETDLIRQKWVAKNQYGWNPRIDINFNRHSMKIGSALYFFDSEHWGEILWGSNLDIGDNYRYYEYTGKKLSVSGYIVEEFWAKENLRLTANLQLRHLSYDFDMPAFGSYTGYKYSLDWTFFSPRFGITYIFNNKINMFGSLSVAHREPEDALIYDADYPYARPAVDDNNKLLANPEQVFDYELGINYLEKSYHMSLNLYWMDLRDEIILANGIDDDGRPRLINAERSIHRGVEFDGSWRIDERIKISGNASFNYDRLKSFMVENDNDWDGTIDETINYSGNIIAGFPEYMANLILDYRNDKYFRLVYRLRSIGRQYIDNANSDELAIDPYLTASLSSSILLKKFERMGTLTISLRIDNLFNEKYELTGVVAEGWPYYIPAAERSYFLQLKWTVE